MAVRKTGLGRGIDKMFPNYSGTDTEQAEQGKSSDLSKSKTASPGDRKKPGNGKAGSSSGKASAKKTIAKATAGKLIEKEITKLAADALGQVVTLKISEVEPNREQPRKTFNEDGLQELSDSIRQYGIIQPLLVQKRDDYYEIIAGERRWRAAKIAGLKKIPVIIRDYDQQKAVEISLIENIQREDLNPIEEASAYLRLLEEFHLKQDEVAERVAKSRSTITNSLRLLKLDSRVQQMLIEEKISSGHARALLSVEDPEQQYEIATKVFDQKLSVRDVEKMMRQLQKPAPVKKEKPDQTAYDLICRGMEERMKEILGTKVVVNRKTDKKGKIEIEYYSNEELERIYDLVRSINVK